MIAQRPRRLRGCSDRCCSPSRHSCRRTLSAAFTVQRARTGTRVQARIRKSQAHAGQWNATPEQGSNSSAATQPDSAVRLRCGGCAMRPLRCCCLSEWDEQWRSLRTGCSISCNSFHSAFEALGSCPPSLTRDAAVLPRSVRAAALLCGLQDRTAWMIGTTKNDLAYYSNIAGNMGPAF